MTDYIYRKTRSFVDSLFEENFKYVMIFIGILTLVCLSFIISGVCSKEAREAYNTCRKNNFPYAVQIFEGACLVSRNGDWHLGN